MSRFPRNESRCIEVEIEDAVFIRQTDLAVMVQRCDVEPKASMEGSIVRDTSKGDIWIPKSQMLDGSDNPDYKQPGELIYLVLPEWLAIEKELI